ncbi:MAG: CHAT domain-containing protein [Chloroflexota bacterium]
MKRDIVVSFRSSGARSLEVLVTPPWRDQPGPALKKKRKAAVLTADEIRELQNGRPSVAVVSNVRDKLTDWLLDVDLGPYVESALELIKDGPVRVAIAPEPAAMPQVMDIPFELLALYKSNTSFVVMHGQAASIVHVLPDGQQVSTERRWPLRILLVRSNPGDQTGTVPKLAPLRDAIVQLGAKLGPDLVKVDLLSNELVGGQRGSAVTKKAFIAQLQAVPYDVLVYLGHGSLEELIPGSQPTSALLFEKAGGENADDHDPMDAAQLNGVFKSLPAKVPVVLLTGCLTAAETPNEKEQYLEKLALQRLRGSQAIAQALVNSPDTGVQLVVGMRYRLEASAAMTFLEGFFQGLLQRHPGNVEAAVRTGREALFQEAVHPPQWSAPVVFRTLAPEPFFDFMTRPPAGATVTAAPRPAATNGFGLAAASTGPVAPVGPSGGDGSGNLAGPGPTQDTIVPGWLPSPTEERDLLYRTVAWDALVQQPVSMRTADSLQFPTQILEQSEQRLRQRGLADGVVLMPERVEVQHDQPAVVTVRLYGAAFVDWVNGRVVSSSDALKIDSVEPTPALTAAGFQLLTGRVSATSTSFRIQRSQEDGGGILPESLLLVNLRAGPEFPVVNTVRADFLSMSQVRPVYPIDNAVIVPAP